MVLYLRYGCLDQVTYHVLERVLDDCVQSDFGYTVWLFGQSDSPHHGDLNYVQGYSK